MDIEGQVLDIVRVANEDFARKVASTALSRLVELGAGAVYEGSDLKIETIDLSSVSMGGGGGGGKTPSRSTWAKLLKSVDYTKKKATGFSLQGEWVKDPKNLEGLPEGELVIMSVNRQLSILRVDKGGVATVSGGVSGAAVSVKGAKVLYDVGSDDYGAVVAWCEAMGVPPTKKVDEAEEDDEV